MPPVIVPLALLALGIPALLRAVVGRPRALGAAWIAAFAAVAVAQAAGEIAGTRAVLLGDAQVGLASAAALLVSVLLIVRERASRAR